MHANAALDHRVQVRLDRTLLDEQFPGRCAYLRRGFSHSSEHATGDAGEEIDAVQGSDALHETERIGHGRGTYCVDSIRAQLQGLREENPEKARFCLACGEPFEEQSSERFRRVVTILFSDVVDSTGLGERLDPEPLHQVLSDYYEGVKPVVERHGGALAKFIGDAVMAVFGLTELHEDDALRAVRAAVEMREALTRLNEDFELRYGVVLATRTGINTGTVAGKGFVPTATSWPATPRTAQRVCSRTPTRARSSSPSRRSGSFAIRSRPSAWQR